VSPPISPKSVAKQRLDQLLVERGLATGRGQAHQLIVNGHVRSGERVLDRPGLAVVVDLPLQVEQPEIRYVGRGGIKLAAALDRFPVNVAGVTALDTGASTGGFTDVLLRRGASRVYAVDVGYGQLAWELRNDSRVVVMERTNIRYLQELPEQPALATIDVSFISLDLVLPVVQRLLTPQGQAVCLVKPQFEAGKSQVGKGGVVRDPEAHAMVLRRVLRRARDDGWRLGGLMISPITGPAGNREFLAWLHHGPAEDADDLERTIVGVLDGRPAPSS
jgi:23S rRNA (cytidine1920-2'-O)/16S rRNA (cytidine1409-2'-O)-methyltransferase